MGVVGARLNMAGSRAGTPPTDLWQSEAAESLTWTTNRITWSNDGCLYDLKVIKKDEQTLHFISKPGILLKTSTAFIKDYLKCRLCLFQSCYITETGFSGKRTLCCCESLSPWMTSCHQSLCLQMTTWQRTSPPSQEKAPCFLHSTEQHRIVSQITFHDWELKNWCLFFRELLLVNKL